MIELLQQSAGFLIQTLPIAFIFFAAFGREKLASCAAGGCI